MNSFSAPPVERVLVAFGGPLRSEDLLASAVELASSFRAPLTALFIEDINLVRLSQLPFAQELDRSSGTIRPLDPQRLDRAMRSEVRKLEELLQEKSRHKRISVSVQVVRGHYVSSVVRMAHSRDIVIVDDAVYTQGGRGKSAAWKRPVWVIYDGTERGRRALTLASSIGESYDLDLIILIPEGTGENDVETYMGELPTGRRARVFVLPMADRQRVISTAHRHGAAVLVLPREGDEPAVSGWIGSAVRCPRILV